MPNWLIYVIIGIVILVALIILAVKICKMSPEDRKEFIVRFLIGLVTVAENYFIGTERGKEKIAWVESEFNKTAPWFMKLVLKLTKTTSLEECIELALNKAKETDFDKNEEEK